MITTDTWESYWKNLDNHDWWKKPASEVQDLISSLSSIEKPKILDLGCGLGRHAIAFALAHFTITAVDSSANAIKHLIEWARSLKLQIETLVCDVLDDSLRGETFDVVLSYNVIYHGSRSRFAKSIRHVQTMLKPDGTL